MPVNIEPYEVAVITDALEVARAMLLGNHDDQRTWTEMFGCNFEPETTGKSLSDQQLRALRLEILNNTISKLKYKLRR